MASLPSRRSVSARSRTPEQAESNTTARGITIESVESKLEGDLDARPFLELSKDVRKGYWNIWATFKVKSNASPEALKESAELSPVLDVVTHDTPVSLRIEKA